MAKCARVLIVGSGERALKPPRPREWSSRESMSEALWDIDPALERYIMERPHLWFYEPDEEPAISLSAFNVPLRWRDMLFPSGELEEYELDMTVVRSSPMRRCNKILDAIKSWLIMFVMVCLALYEHACGALSMVV